MRYCHTTITLFWSEKCLSESMFLGGKYVFSRVLLCNWCFLTNSYVCSVNLEALSHAEVCNVCLHWQTVTPHKAEGLLTVKSKHKKTRCIGYVKKKNCFLECLIQKCILPISICDQVRNDSSITNDHILNSFTCRNGRLKSAPFIYIGKEKLQCIFLGLAMCLRKNEF